MRSLLMVIFASVLVSIAPASAFATCSLQMPATDWRRSTNPSSPLGPQKGVIKFECKADSCGGPKNYVVLKQGAIEIRKNGRLVTGPLELDGLSGNRFSDLYGVGEVYIGTNRFVSLIASGVKSSFRRKNLQSLKASVRCQ
jgi:hypothetical protein